MIGYSYEQEGSSMKKRVFENSWGGHGEHGFRYYDYSVSQNSITIYITVKDFNDWGGKSTFQSNYVKEISFPINNHEITKEFLFDCIIKAGKELNETYLLPKVPGDLKL